MFKSVLVYWKYNIGSSIFSFTSKAQLYKPAYIYIYWLIADIHYTLELVSCQVYGDSSLVSNIRLSVEFFWRYINLWAHILALVAPEGTNSWECWYHFLAIKLHKSIKIKGAIWRDWKPQDKQKLSHKIMNKIQFIVTISRRLSRLNGLQETFNLPVLSTFNLSICKHNINKGRWLSSDLNINRQQRMI